MEPEEPQNRRAEEPRHSSSGAVPLLQDLRAELLSMHDDMPCALPKIFGSAMQPNLGMALGSLRELVEESRAGLVRIEGDVEQLRAELHVVKRSLSTSLTVEDRVEQRLDAETLAPTCREFDVVQKAESKLDVAVAAMGTRVAAVEEQCKEQVSKKDVKQEIELIQSTIDARFAQFRETMVMQQPLHINVPEPVDEHKDEDFSACGEDDASHGQQVVSHSPAKNWLSLSLLMARVESLEAVQHELRGTPDDVTELQRRMQLLEHNLTDDICSTLASMSTEISTLVQCLASGSCQENGGVPQEPMSQAAARRFARKELPSTSLGRRGAKRREAASLEEPRTALRPEASVAPRPLSRRAGGVSASPSAYTGSAHSPITQSPHVDDSPQVQEEDTEQAPGGSSNISGEIREAAKAMAEESRTELDQALSLLSTSLRQIWHARNQSLGSQLVGPTSAMTVGYRQKLGDRTSSIAPSPALSAETKRWTQPGAAASVAPAFLASSGSSPRLPLEVSQQASGAPTSPAVSPRLLVPSFIGPGCATTAVPEAHRRLATHPRPGSAVLMLSGGGGAGDKMLSQRSQDMTRFVAAPSPAPGGCDVRWMAPPPRTGCGVPGRSITTAEAGDSAMLTAKKILLPRQEMQSA